MRTTSRVLAAVGGAVALATWLAYRSVIDAQGDTADARVVLWSAVMLAIAALAVVSLIVNRRAASILLALAAAAAAGLGILAILSIGPGFLAAAVALAAACVCALAATEARPAQVL